jgi:hypothetical protein
MDDLRISGDKIRDMSHINIVDTYNRKTGEHLKSVCTSPDGTVIWDDGPNPNKNTVFLDYLEPYWGKFVEDERVPKGEIRMGSWDGPTLMKNIGEANETTEI